MALSVVIDVLPPTNSREPEELKSHKWFIAKIYIISTAFFLGSLMQWVSLTTIDGVVTFIIGGKSYGQFYIWLTFLILLCFMVFYKHIKERSSILAWFCALITAELGTVAIIQPMTTTFYTDIIYSIALMGLVTAATIPLSFQLHEEMQYTPELMLLWTGRYFLLSSLGIMMIKSLSETRLEVFFAIFTIWFLSMFILVFGRALGSTVLFKAHSSSDLLFGVCAYYNLVSLLANSLVFVAALRKLH